MRREMVVALVGLMLLGLVGCESPELIKALSERDSARLRVEELLADLGERNRTILGQEKTCADAQSALREAKDEAARYKTDAETLAAMRDQLKKDNAALKQLAADLKEFATLVHRGGEVGLRMKSDVLFGAGKAELLPDAQVSLDKVADFLLKSDGRKIRIDGHTDGQPLKATRAKWGNNYRLASERALAVREYLAGRGVPAVDMIVAGYGPNSPAVEPEAPEAEAPANRRVEIMLVRPASAATAEEPH
jgi:outer membrane protein OmpA-like peptidoglycan-associated protein